MRDINLPMRKAYNALLKGNLTNNAAQVVSVYYQNAPDDVKALQYVIIENVSNTDNSTMNTVDLRCTIQVTIRTFDQVANSGIECDRIAGQILELVYPNRLSAMAPDNLQVSTARLVTDTVQGYTLNNTRNYVDRILRFEHKIHLQNVA